MVGIALQGPDGDIAHTLTWDVAAGLPQIAAWSIDGQTRQLIHGHGVVGHASDDATGAFSRDVHGSLQTGHSDDGLVAADSYGPYGAPTTDPEGPVTLGYRGELHVQGLIHLRARDYDPTVGAFTTLDPLDGLDGQVTVANGYHYAANDPINRIDPTGLTPFSDDEIRRLYMYGARDARELYMQQPAPHVFSPPQSRAVPEQVGWGRRGTAIVADLLPFVGTGKGAVELVTGADPITGEELGWGWRLAGLLPVVPALRGLRGVRAGARTTLGGPGVVRTVNESMSTRAAAYQQRVTGLPPGSVYEVRGVRFDGLADGFLLEAKGPGLATHVAGGRFKPYFRGADDFAMQAQRQLDAARGTPIRWVVAEPETATAIQNLFRSRGISGIEVLHYPPG